MSSYLMVIYGAPEGRNEFAWHLAHSLPGKSAILSVDQLLGGSIAQGSDDVSAELDMVHTQLRLLVANYMRNGYNVVVEGTFYYQRSDATLRYEQDIDQLVALMRNMTARALTVHWQARDEAVKHSYRPRYGPNVLVLNASCSLDDVTSTVLDRLLVEDSI